MVDLKCANIFTLSMELNARHRDHLFLDLVGIVRVTVETPSTNFVRKTTLALLNMPSLSETTMNCECEKWDRIIWPIFWVCERSSAASTSSRMYIGAGLNSSNERISERASSERCPPLSSVKLSFHTPPNETRT